MKIGYACLVVGEPDTTIKTTRKVNATAERLTELIEHNLKSMENMLDYNIQQNIKMYRISSDIIPFGSDLETNTLKWWTVFSEDFKRLSKKIKENDIRVSMHPGQYTVLNSLDENVVNRAIADLDYHTKFLDSLEVDSSHKIILHIGGIYGDKASAIERFVENYARLSPEVKARLIIENDDRLYTIADVLEISHKTAIPVVYDNLHNDSNPSDFEKTDKEWINLTKETWHKKDGRTKIHYSQQRENARIGAHTQTIYIKPFMEFYVSVSPVEVDIMLEVKDKNLSAVKSILATANDLDISVLEKEWARYKYAVLSRSPQKYQEIRSLLKDKTAYPVIEFYTLIEEALDTIPNKNTELNALDHVWGYFKKISNNKEKEKYQKLKTRWLNEEIRINQIKKWLKKLAEQYDVSYLKNSLYFD